MGKAKWALDDDGQPLIGAWNAARRVGRNTDELIGIMRGILADGRVVRDETDFLASWIQHNAGDIELWPTCAIVDRLLRVYEDDVVTEEELEDFRVFLKSIVGEGGAPGHPSELPLTKPAPDVIFDQNVFVFTGRCVTGTRKFCQSETEILGGICEDTVTLRTDYLVIGSCGTIEWRHSGWGGKIERAIELQRSKPHLYIISEERWCAYRKGVA